MLGKRRILVADDDLEMRTLIAEVLTEAGFEVTVCNDGNALLAALHASLGFGVEPLPALIVSDFHMPGLNGLSLLALARALDCEAPFILMTAFDDGETKRAAREFGVTAVLEKPFDVWDLLRTVRLHID